jgi:two-component system OmpR family response regulator
VINVASFSTLTNPEPDSQADTPKRAGINGWFERPPSIDRVHRFGPAPQAYHGAAVKLHVAPGAGSGQHVSEPGARQTRILVADSDQNACRKIARYLEEQNIQVISVAGRHGMRCEFEAQELDLVVLDLGLALEDGLNILRDIRSCSNASIIIAAGRQCGEVDRVVGLELGADDWLTKPICLRELLARIRAILRRRRHSQAVASTNRGRRSSKFGGWLLDRRSRRLSDPAGAPVALTNSEFALLVAFLDTPQRPLTREYLLQATRVHLDAFDRSIDVRILRLRRKLEGTPQKPRLIRTERGIGYIFLAPVEHTWDCLRE